MEVPIAIFRHFESTCTERPVDSAAHVVGICKFKFRTGIFSSLSLIRWSMAHSFCVRKGHFDLIATFLHVFLALSFLFVGWRRGNPKPSPVSILF